MDSVDGELALNQQMEVAQVQDAYQVLNYNQQLIQFADSKAGNLIVVNSLFIAAAQATGLRPDGSLHWMASAGYVILASVAVLYCLTVIMCKIQPGAATRKDLIFFDDIVSRRTADAYAREFRNTRARVKLDDILRRTHTLAAIAQRKFSSYGTAQQLTAAAAYTWVVSNALLLLR